MTVQAATPAATSTFEVKGLTAGYGKQPIIFDVSARFVTGTLSAIIGPNGAGKSTLLKALFGIARVFQGSVLLDGDPVSLVSTSLVRQGIVYVPQLANVFPSLTVRENLEVGTFVRSGGALSRVLDLFPDLAPVMAKHAGKLSGGQRNMLAVARALMSDPRVLLLDEFDRWAFPGTVAAALGAPCPTATGWPCGCRCRAERPARVAALGSCVCSRQRQKPPRGHAS